MKGANNFCADFISANMQEQVNLSDYLIIIIFLIYKKDYQEHIKARGHTFPRWQHEM